MRVIAGSAKGTNLKAVPGMMTRPTTDKVKESIFNMIGPYFDGGVALDLFAGTGSLGIEALSRGLSHAIFIDQDKNSIDIIYKNLEATKLNPYAEVFKNDYLRALKALTKREIQFDLVFLDPPYRMKIIDKILHFLADNRLVSLQSLIIVEHDAKYNLSADISPFKLIRNVVYGDTGVTIFQFQPR